MSFIIHYIVFRPNFPLHNKFFEVGTVIYSKNKSAYHSTQHKMGRVSINDYWKNIKLREEMEFFPDIVVYKL